MIHFIYHFINVHISLSIVTLAEGTAARVSFQPVFFFFFCLSTTNRQSRLTKRIVGSKKVMFTA